MKKTSGSMILVALALAGVVGGASAQACAGLPTANGQGSLGVSTQLPAGADFGDILGFEASYNDPGPVSVFGGVTAVDDEPNDAVYFYTAGFAVELLSVAASIGPNVSVCPQTALTYSGLGGGGSLISVPLGIGIGTSVVGSSGIGVSPYAVPQFIISRAAANGVGPGGTRRSRARTSGSPAG